jgi:subtilisin family serine protease
MKLAMIMTLLLSCSTLLAKDFVVKVPAGSSLADTIAELEYMGFEYKEALVPSMGMHLFSENVLRVSPHSQQDLHSAFFVDYAGQDMEVTWRSNNPDDEKFNDQWSLVPTEQANIGAEEAWKISTGGKNALGEEVVAAVVDMSFDPGHEDLKDNVWVNEGEIPGNNKDDDGNGYVDDVNGYMVGPVDGRIRDHGTHVAGTVGAKGNNGLHTTGVNWDTTMLLAKITGRATTAVVLKAYGYMLMQKKLYLESEGKEGANIVAINSSFGHDRADCSSPNFRPWNEMYDELGKHGILSIAATANRAYDVDSVGDVPTACESEFIVAVTNTDNKDELYKSSWGGGAAWGAENVDLGAPGTNIVSTVPGNKTGTKTGTSMATPHVTGAVTLMHSAASEEFQQLYKEDPAAGALKLKEILLNTTKEVPTLKDVTVTGGRLDLGAAVTAIHNFKR